MEQIKPLSPNIDNMKALVYEINMSNNALVQAINDLEEVGTGRKVEYKEKSPLFHILGGSKRSALSAKYYALGEVSSHDVVPNNTIYTTGNNTYWIKDDTGAPREIASSGEGGAYLPIDGKAADSELLDGYDSSEFVFNSNFNSHVNDSTIHFERRDISHTSIRDIGVNTHGQIDTHIATNGIHYSMSSIDHGVISGLADDDHLQYHTDARGDARYYTKTLADSTFEPIFSKNTAFNKNFGTIAGTVSEGNHLHAGLYEPANANIQSHIASTSNPHSVTPSQVGNDTAQWNAYKLYNTPIDATVGTPTDGDVLVYRSAGGDFVLETKPTSGVDDHGNLSGLGDDDHTQYYNQSRGDARYGQLSATNYWTARQDVDSFYWKEGAEYINSDPRWSGTNGRIHWWATNGSGTPYGQFGHALYNGSSYTNIDTVSGEDGIRVTDKVEAYNNTSEGSYVGLFKGLGSLPGFPSNRYPTIKTDYATLYFSAGGRYSAGNVSSSSTSTYMFSRGESGEVARLTGSNDGYAGLYAKYTGTGVSTLQQNSSGGAVTLQNNAGTTTSVIRSYGDSYFNGGKVGIGTSSPDLGLTIEENASSFIGFKLKNSVSSSGTVGYFGNSNSHTAAYFISCGSTHITQPNQLSLKNLYGDVTIYTGTGGSSSEALKIDTSGDVTLSGTIQQDSWIAATLLNSWVNVGTGYDPIAYRLGKDGRVYFRGSTKDGTSGVIFTLPAAYRPQNFKNFPVVVNEASADKVVRLLISYVNGNVILQTSDNDFVCLDGVNFELD